MLEAIAPALCSVSLNSFSATESETIPAPDCTNPLLFSMKILLIAIAKSQHPLYEKYPTAPAYGLVLHSPNSSIICIALTLGAPEQFQQEILPERHQTCHFWSPNYQLHD